MLRVDLGCGTNKPNGFMGVDTYPAPGVDIVADLNQQFPFLDNSVDELRAYDVIEHLLDRIHTMNEIWRICKPGAKVDIFVPSTDGRGAFQDPTHISFWNINSFLYYSVDFPHYLELCRRYGFKGAFKVLRLDNEETFAGVIHVRAELNVVKIQADSNSRFEHELQQNIASKADVKLEKRQGSSLRFNSANICNAFEIKNNFFPIIDPVSNEIDRPLWSVMIPTYNGTKYLEQTLRSVLEQDPGSDLMQIEVVDDCSTQDDPEELVREIGQGRVSFYRQPKNLGLIGNWNDCIRRVQGHWVHILHQDDVVKFGFYSRLQAAIEKEPTIGAAFCRYFYMDKKGCLQALSLLERETPGVISNWIERIAVVQQIQFPSIVVKRKLYEKLGGFCPEAHSAADWEMWKRIAAHYSVWYEPEPLACYRLHSLSESSRLIKSGTNIADTRRSIEISRSYLPRSIAAELSNKALEHYAFYALNTARQMLNIGDQSAAMAQMQEGLKCNQSSKVKEALVSILLKSDLDDSNHYLVQLSDYVEQYQKAPNYEDALIKLRDTRNEVANQLLNLQPDELKSAYTGNLGELHKILLNSGIKNETLTDAEQSFINEIVAHIYSAFDTSKAINYLLAAMLYRRADQLSLPYDLPRIPNYIFNDYLKFMLYSPGYFQEIGEADSYYRYMQEFIDYLHTNILSNPESKTWQNAALFFTDNVNFIPLYFNSKNLRDVYVKRADIIEFALKNQGHQIDYDFPERSPERKKIRLGILAAHFGPQTETFTTLPVYKHLNRDLFEIILYTLQVSNHRLERYCWGHADTFITLPQDLPSQVQTIRDGDLDIILIATNVTAVTNPITLLALHKLARVQAASTSSCVTTGIRHVDSYISGELTEPENNTQQHYTETLVTINGPAHCHDFATEEQLVSTISVSRESLGIEQNSVVFVSGANFYKIIPEVETAWAKIIAEVPNSKLLLYPFNPNWSSSYPVSSFKKRIVTTFKSYGLSENRLVILEPVPDRADVKKRLKIADVYLDSYPFSSINSLIDPLELGLPTVVMEGNSFRTLMGPALLRELQTPDLIADDEESYIQLAIALGTNPELRQQKSDQIKERMRANPRFLDSRSYSAQMGTVFQELFHKHQAIALTETLKLRETNLIIFPDWSQQEELLYQDLASVITNLVNHPDKNQITLLIHIGNLAENDANLFLSEVVMNLLMEEDLDVADGPEISLFGQLGEMQWETLLPRIQARIVLENENQQAIAQTKAETIPSCELDKYCSTISS